MTTKPTHNKSPGDKKPQHGARIVAANAVRAVFRDKTPLDQALSSQALFHQLDPRDRAFARLIAASVFRRSGQINKVLSAYIKKNTPDITLAVLRCGVAQILFLDTPPHAAVNGAVATLRRSKKTAHMAGLANAVLRRISEAGPAALKHTSTLDNIPKWLRTSWYKTYGGKALQSMADQLALDPPLDLTIKPGEPHPDGKILPGGTVRLSKAGNIQALPGYKNGGWWVQDVSAALPVRLLGDVNGKTVLDMCAAPGGKTLQLAAAGAKVTALDKHEDRLTRLKENLTRTGLSVDIVCADAVRWQDPRPDGFDIVLLDAPCSATGTYRRRPDVLSTKTPEDVASLVRLQQKLLLSAARKVKSGGTLVYCTCSLQPEEGEAQMHTFLQNRSDFRLNSLLSTNCPKGQEAEISEGYWRILPHYMKEQGGQDGFFIAAFTRC